MTEKNLTVPHNPLIESRYKLSVTEQRLIQRLVAMIGSDDEDCKQYVIDVANWTDILGLESGDSDKAISKAIDRLMDTPIKFCDGDDIVTVKWLSSSRYQPKTGHALLRFDPQLKPLFLQLKELSASYRSDNVIQLKHIHSIRLYELLKPYEPIGKRRFSVAELREALLLGEGVYSQYRDFRRWVLKVSQAELQEKTDIRVELIEEKRGRVVEFIEFMISPKGKASIKANGSVSETVGKQQQETPSDAPYIGQLVDMGVAYVEAIQLLKDYGGEKIERAIAFTKEKQKEGHVKKPDVLVVAALQQGLADRQVLEDLKTAETIRL